MEEFAQVRDAMAEDKFKLAGAKWRSHLVFYHFHASHCSDVAPILLDVTESPHIESERSVEFEGMSASGHLGIAKGDVDFLTQLVDEDAGGASFSQRCRDFAQGLAHESCLQSEFVIAHLSF